MPTTANKGYSQPTFNSNVGTWGVTDLNGNSSILDNNLGGVASISLSNANVTLSSSQAQNLVIKLSGTLSANVVVSSPNIGFCMVENNCTGAYTVNWVANFGSGSVGSQYLLGQGMRALLVSDTSAGARVADSGLVPSGTRTTFFQASAPTGWTQVTTLNDYLPRIVNGTGGGTSAGTGFSSVNASVTTAGHTLTTAEMPSHTHTDSGHTHPLAGYQFAAGGNNFYSYITVGSGITSGIGHASLSNTGGGGSHSHGLTLNISYLDLILCSRN